MRFIALCSAVLLLAGCVETTSTSGGKIFGDSTSPRPKTIMVTDFTVSSDLVVIDRGYTARLERKIGPYPTYERKQRTLERVNNEIIATIVATLRSSGLDAQAGSEEGSSLSSRVVVASGRLIPTNPAAKKNEAGIGPGFGGVSVEMALTSLSSFGKKKLTGFKVEGAGSKKSANAKTNAAMNASVAEALGADNAVKLTPEVEATARALGRAVGEKIVAYAREQGWLNKPDDGAAEEPKPEGAKSEGSKPEGTKSNGNKPAAAAESEKMVRLPPARPSQKPAA